MVWDRRLKPLLRLLLHYYCPYSRVLAMYQIILGWETYTYYYETNELRNPRPTQPMKN